MTNTDFAIGKPIANRNFATRFDMASTLTNERTNGTDAYQDSGSISHVLDARTPVDNPELVVAGMALHELIGVDSLGQTCSCGIRSSSQLEHLADVAVFLMCTTKPDPVPLCAVDGCEKRQWCRAMCQMHYTSDLRARKANSEAKWVTEQRRLHNLASFQHMQDPVPAPVRRSPRPRFTIDQLAIAERVLDMQEAAAA